MIESGLCGCILLLEGCIVHVSFESFKVYEKTDNCQVNLYQLAKQFQWMEMTNERQDLLPCCLQFL